MLADAIGDVTITNEGGKVMKLLRLPPGTLMTCSKSEAKVQKVVALRTMKSC
jgi:hypothetical protein